MLRFPAEDLAQKKHLKKAHKEVDQFQKQPYNRLPVVALLSGEIWFFEK